MSRKLSPLIAWSQYLAARVAATALTISEVETNLHAAAHLGRWLYRSDKRHRTRTFRHLRIAFPDKSHDQIRQLAQKSFESLVQLVVEILYSPRLLHGDSRAQRTHRIGLAPSIRLINEGKPIIFVTGHVGNWEVLGYLLGILGLQVSAIARPLDNWLLGDWLYGIRQRRGLQIITKWGATAHMLEVIERGGGLAFIADQNAGDRGVFVPFFGRLASSYKSIGLLAINRRVPIVCGYARRVGEQFQYEVGVVDTIQPEDWESHDDPLFYVTARYMHAIETMVRQSPHQYLWMHRRWKSRPRFELQGRPMPVRLRKNLEELPWLDGETLQSLIGQKFAPVS